MASIGPQIPSRLQKRSTTPDLDDERGPIPKAPSAPSASIGPQIPANLLPARAGGPAPVPSGHNDEDEDEDEDSFGPALPPDLAISRTAPERLPVSSGTASQTRRIVGPSMPGHDRQTESDDSDSDDDYGPKPMAAGVSESDGLNEGVREFMEKEERRRKEVEVCAMKFVHIASTDDASHFHRKLRSRRNRNVTSGCWPLHHHLTSLEVSFLYQFSRNHEYQLF